MNSNVSLIKKIRKKFWKKMFQISAVISTPLILLLYLLTPAPIWFLIFFISIATFLITSFLSMLKLSKKYPKLFIDSSQVHLNHQNYNLVEPHQFSHDDLNSSDNPFSSTQSQIRNWYTDPSNPAGFTNPSSPVYPINLIRHD